MGQRRFQTYAAARLGPGTKVRKSSARADQLSFRYLSGCSFDVAQDFGRRLPLRSRRLSAKRAETCET